MLHDIGKVLTKSFLDTKGNKSETAHYYNHENASAYNCVFFLKKLGLFSLDDIINISLMIQYHMKPYYAWSESKKCKERDRDLLGEYIFNSISLIHEADKGSH